MPEADVISARAFYDNYVNVGCHKRAVGGQSLNSNGRCPSKIVGCFGRPNTPTANFDNWTDSSDSFHDNYIISQGDFITQKMVDGVLTEVVDPIFDDDSWFVAKNSTYFSNNKTISRQLRSDFETVTSLKTMPAASEYFNGMTVQYLGETTDSYTHGLFYDCKEVLPSTDPKTYEWVSTIEALRQ
jgi:hypothetical protein